MKHKCLLCDFEGTKSQLWHHVENVHGISKDDYMWGYVYGHQGSPKCMNCGSKLVYSRYTDKRFCSRKCNVEYLHSSEQINRKRCEGLKQSYRVNPDRIQKNVENMQRGVSHALKDPDFKKRKSEQFKKLLKSYDFMVKELEGRGVNLNTPALVYLVELNSGNLKLGFTTNWNNRKRHLDIKRVVKLKHYSTGYIALKEEYRIHEILQDKNLFDGSWYSSEQYPKELEDTILSYMDNV